MASLKGTKTEHNLLASFAGESQARNRTIIFLLRRKKKGSNKYPGFLPTQQTMKKNTRKDFLNSSRVAWLR